MNKPKLLFISPRFLFPVNTGGQIRTTQILRGMKGGKFEIILASPAPKNGAKDYAEDLVSVCDRYISWQEKDRNGLFKFFRFKYIGSRVPISVATDKSTEGSACVLSELAEKPDVVIYDFPHSAILGPNLIPVPSVMFTHNVESEIFLRHAKVADNPLKKTIWNNQYKKMERYENEILKRFDSVVAVSERDKELLHSLYAAKNISVINTGVDLEFFQYQVPGPKQRLVFTGSMDWYANIDGIEYLMDDIWPLLREKQPDLEMCVVGRNPPTSLVDKTRERGYDFHFTGFVDDVRPYVYESNICVVPLRVGGGTRLKVFEAMAMGCPMISTSIGVEGLPVEEGVHYIKADTAEEFANAIELLLGDEELRKTLSMNARRYVENNFSFEKVANEFEKICGNAIKNTNV